MEPLASAFERGSGIGSSCCCLCGIIYLVQCIASIMVLHRPMYRKCHAIALPWSPIIVQCHSTLYFYEPKHENAIGRVRQPWSKYKYVEERSTENMTM